LLPSGEQFHVYVPSSAQKDAPLIGWRWMRGDTKTEAAVTEALAGVVEQAVFPADDGKLARTRVRRQRVKSYVRFNDCARCHVAQKPVDTEHENVIHRGTDAVGWFVPQTVLADRTPLEYHRPRDTNVDDKHLVARCRDGTVAQLALGERGARRYTCAAGNGWPVGEKDLRAALVEKNPHAQAVCASRRWLFEHMTPAARQRFADGFAACGVR
jgi:hypothetical protein